MFTNDDDGGDGEGGVGFLFTVKPVFCRLSTCGCATALGR